MSWLSFDAVSSSATYRTFTGNPTNAEVGDHTLKVSVNDGNGGTADHTFTLTVSNTNDAPVPSAIAPLAVTAGKPSSSTAFDGVHGR